MYKVVLLWNINRGFKIPRNDGFWMMAKPLKEDENTLFYNKVHIRRRNFHRCMWNICSVLYNEVFQVCFSKLVDWYRFLKNLCKWNKTDVRSLETMSAITILICKWYSRLFFLCSARPPGVLHAPNLSPLFGDSNSNHRLQFIARLLISENYRHSVLA